MYAILVGQWFARKSPAYPNAMSTSEEHEVNDRRRRHGE